jgi:CelD/BcsL family acetyltransferase involved in cellulose biosynthesis
MWEGDRPQILADGDESLVWKTVIDFLCDGLRGWEVLELREQPVAGPRQAGWGFLSRSGLLWEKRPDAVGYYIPLSGSWDDYLGGLSSNTRGDWRRKARRLSTACGGYELECVSDSRRMAEGLERFIALERSGWKRDAGVGLAQDETHRRFYADIVGRLASRSEVGFHFLKCKGEDVAGLVNFAHRDVVYMRQTAYLPTHAQHSPGVILLAEVARQLFGDRFREYDLLGMREDEASQRYKLQWARGRRETVEWMAYRVRTRLLPWLMARGVYRTLRSLSTGWPKALSTGAPATLRL